MRNVSLALLFLSPWAGAQEIAPVRFAVSPVGLAALAGPVLRIATLPGALSLQAVPQIVAPRLAPSVVALSAPKVQAPDARPAVESARRLAAGVEKGGFSAASAQVYDNGAKPVPALAAPDAPAPKTPSGVKTVTVRTVRTAEDVSRFIPSGRNSDELIAGLRGNVGKMAPYDVRTYEDVRGGRFTGIDISGRPGLVEQIPELQAHEVALIKKILARNPDVQVLVREDGKTPDLVVGGKIVELKSFIFRHEDYDSFMGGVLLAKANEQVLRHGERHGYKGGYIAVDLALHGALPADVPKFIERWLKAKKSPVVVDKIFVFAGGELMAFERQGDGSFKQVEPTFAVLAVFGGFSLS